MIATDSRGSWNASVLRSPRFLLLPIVLFAALALFFARPYAHIPSVAHTVKSDQPPNALLQGKPPAGSSDDARNATLGFEKVFVINLPERYDKLDAFSIAASLTGFTHEVIEGIRGSTVVNKTLPTLENLPEKEGARNNIVGCWRAHLNVAQKIVRDRISTALVLEDDSDWDVSFKDQLADFATGSRYISSTTSKPRSPYGDEWDLLWLGHCSAQQAPTDQRRFVIENDDTVPPMNHRLNFNQVPKMAELGYDNSTRIVFRANNGVCLYSYALSFRGAQKVLRWQNTVKEFNPIDMGIGYQCRDDPNFRCIAAYPQLVDSHKAAGRESQDSDIGAFDPKKIREKGLTWNIARSTRLNVDNLIYGGSEAKIEDQWSDLPELVGPRRTRFE
ncbi:MAG: hypothetical protein Q9181_002103 [Wetmoreana brouardii]